ncbi:MAG: hypothetical protein L7F77_00020 [Candidatus Magnetominusculus sp. LBB02]|nr:hypothetical protein [Candidatus Magnetominusculus sp. LBB02]
MGKKSIWILMILLLSYGVSAAIEQGSLPGDWRPFSDTSPWNQPIPADAKTHPNSEAIMNTIVSEAKNIRLAKIYSIPVWVVNSKKTPTTKVRSTKIYDTWDKHRAGVSDVAIPVTREMWAEPTDDGHICIVDPAVGLSWEMSSYKWRKDDETPRSSTFNIWNMKGTGVGNHKESERWYLIGGRGSGFPLIAGLIRPEELKQGEIRHAMVFTFPKNRRPDRGEAMFIPPAARSDGAVKGAQYPVEGMRFQLNPVLTEKDFDGWGLNREGKIIAKALQKYGMLLGDNGGAMALQAQLLAPDDDDNVGKWNSLFPGFYKNIEKIPTSQFRVVYTGEPVIK